MKNNFTIYNSLSRKKEPFEPLNSPFVGIYVCGPTVYSDPHLGHARPAITFDLLYRYLTHLAYKVRYVRNITDVGHLENDADEGEDKIEKKARLEHLEPMEVVQKYLNRISGPLLDRIDIHIEVVPVKYDKLSDTGRTEKSEVVRERVVRARAIQSKRFESVKGVYANAQMSSSMQRRYCQIDEAGGRLLRTAMELRGLSARAYDRILKVARTIADLAESDNITAEHISEAINYRNLDREGWAG